MSCLQKFKGRINDYLLAGGLGGLIGAIPMDLSNLLLWHLKLSEATFAAFGASDLTDSWRAESKGALIIGEMQHLIFQAMAGVSLSWMLRQSGRKYYLLKGMGCGLFLWMFPFQMVGRHHFHRIRPKSFQGQYAALFNQIIWGISAARAMVYLVGPKVYPQAVFEETEAVNKKLPN